MRSCIATITISLIEVTANVLFKNIDYYLYS